MIGGFPNTIYGKPGRDEEIDKVRQSIRAAGKAGLPVVEYNFYAHRAMEGYYEEPGRAGAGIHGLRLQPHEGSAAARRRGRAQPGRDVDQHHLFSQGGDSGGGGSRACAWRCIPTIRRRRSAAARSRSWARVAGWKKLIAIVNSPSNGITFDCGVTREMGEDPVEVCRYFASRDRINHVHFRNVRVMKPYEKYAEVFIDEGQVDMFAVMKELVRNKYTRTIYPEHPRRHRLRSRASGIPARRIPAAADTRRSAFNVGFAQGDAAGRVGVVCGAVFRS